MSILSDIDRNRLLTKRVRELSDATLDAMANEGVSVDSEGRIPALAVAQILSAADDYALGEARRMAGKRGVVNERDPRFIHLVSTIYMTTVTAIEDALRRAGGLPSEWNPED